MDDVNNVVLSGWINQPPNFYAANGSTYPLCLMCITTHINPYDGEKIEINIETRGPLAMRVQKYMMQGQHVLVYGHFVNKPKASPGIWIQAHNITMMDDRVGRYKRNTSEVTHLETGKPEEKPEEKEELPF